MIDELWQKEMNHKPTKEYYEGLKDLIENYFPKAVVPKWRVFEIGVRTGISTRAFLESPYVSELVSVDSAPCREARHMLKIAGLDKKWKFIQADSLSYVNNTNFEKGSFDICFVDGSHIEKETSVDMNNCWEMLKKPGILLCDDVQHQKNYNEHDIGMGVARAFWGVMYGKKRVATFYPTFNGLAYIIK